MNLRVEMLLKTLKLQTLLKPLSLNNYPSSPLLKSHNLTPSPLLEDLPEALKWNRCLARHPLPSVVATSTPTLLPYDLHSRMVTTTTNLTK